MIVVKYLYIYCKWYNPVYHGKLRDDGKYRRALRIPELPEVLALLFIPQLQVFTSISIFLLTNLLHQCGKHSEVPYIISQLWRASVSDPNWKFSLPSPRLHHTDVFYNLPKILQGKYILEFLFLFYLCVCVCVCVPIYPIFPTKVSMSNHERNGVSLTPPLSAFPHIHLSLSRVQHSQGGEQRSLDGIPTSEILPTISPFPSTVFVLKKKTSTSMYLPIRPDPGQSTCYQRTPEYTGTKSKSGLMDG